MSSATTLSEVFGDNPLHLRHVKPLDFASFPSIPDTHVWSDASSASFAPTLSFTIPTVDLADPDAAHLVGQACETWGVFQVTNHGIPLELLEEVEAETARLFALPTAQKMKAARSPAGGATGYGVAKIAPFFRKMMWHEGFTIIGSPVDHAKALWPNEYQRFCNLMEDYQEKAKELTTTLMQLILNFFAITPQEIKWDQYPASCGSGPTTALQLNSYPPCPDPTRTMGLAPHTDTSLLTILHQTGPTRGGLEIFKEGVGWGSVASSPNNVASLIVNVGDFLHILSNGRFPSVVHRVVMKEARQRYSMAFFYVPPLDFIVSPDFLLNSVQIHSTPRYRPVSVRDFVSIKNKNLEEALALIRV